MKWNFLGNKKKAVGAFCQSIDEHPSVNPQEIFVGREQEIRKFQRILEKLYTDSQETENYIKTMVIYGIGGIGKSRLCKEFRRIANDKKKYPNLVQIYVDWPSDTALMTKEELLDTLARSLEDQFPREMRLYSRMKKCRQAQQNIQEPEIWEYEDYSREYIKRPLPIKLKRKIIDSLKNLPSIDESRRQHSLISKLGIDPELEAQIIFGEPSEDFVPLLVNLFIKYGEFEDGRNAIEELLKIAKQYVGKRGKAHYDLLINELREVQYERIGHQPPKRGGTALSRVLSMLLCRIFHTRKGMSEYSVNEANIIRCLHRCITTLTQKKKRILFILDTCEALGVHESWLVDRFLIPLVDRNPYIVLIFSGRFNVYKQHTRIVEAQEFVISGFEEKMRFYSGEPLEMQVLELDDIKEYLRRWTGKEIDQSIADFVKSYSCGVPYAVTLLIDAFNRLGYEETIDKFSDRNFREDLKKKLKNEEVVKHTTERFMKYCITDLTDRYRILSLVVLEDIDPETLKKAWQVEYPHAALERLYAQYALFIGGELHDEVRKFLYEYVLQYPHLRKEIARSFVERVLPDYWENYAKFCQKKSAHESRFDDVRWQKAAQRLMNALVWSDPHEAVNFLLKRSIELFFINPAFIDKLKQPLERFVNFEENIRELDNIHILVEALLNFVNNIRTSEDRRLWIQEFLAEGELEPVHRTILCCIDGWNFYQQNRYEEALRVLLSCQYENIPDRNIIDRMAVILDNIGVELCMDKQNYNIYLFNEHSLKAFEKALHLNEYKPGVYYHLGVMIYLSGEPQNALDYYQKSLELHPDDANVLNSLGNVHRDLGKQNSANYYEALALYKRANQFEPNLASPYIGSGDVYCYLGEYTKAIEFYEQAIALEPNLANSHVGLGNAYYMLGHYQQAQNAYQNGIQCGGWNLAKAYNGLGNVYYALGDYDNAKEAYYRAIELDAKYIEPLNGLGAVYENLGQYDKAEEAYLKAIEIDQKYKNAYCNLGDVYGTLGELKKAEKMYQVAYQLDPNFQEAKIGLSEVLKRL